MKLTFEYGDGRSLETSSDNEFDPKMVKEMFDLLYYEILISNIGTNHHNGAIKELYKSIDFS